MGGVAGGQHLDLKDLEWTEHCPETFEDQVPPGAAPAMVPQQV